MFHKAASRVRRLRRPRSLAIRSLLFRMVRRFARSIIAPPGVQRCCWTQSAVVSRCGRGFSERRSFFRSPAVYGWDEGHQRSDSRPLEGPDGAGHPETDADGSARLGTSRLGRDDATLLDTNHRSTTVRRVRLLTVSPRDRIRATAHLRRNILRYGRLRDRGSLATRSRLKNSRLQDLAAVAG
jgi:hypothetical protein